MKVQNEEPLPKSNTTYRGFTEVPDQLGMAILSIITGNPLLWTFLMQHFNLGIVKMSLIVENPLFPNPVLPKTSVLLQHTD